MHARVSVPAPLVGDGSLPHASGRLALSSSAPCSMSLHQPCMFPACAVHPWFRQHACRYKLGVVREGVARPGAPVVGLARAYARSSQSLRAAPAHMYQHPVGQQARAPAPVAEGVLAWLRGCAPGSPQTAASLSIQFSTTYHGHQVAAKPDFGPHRCRCPQGILFLASPVHNFSKPSAQVGAHVELVRGQPLVCTATRPSALCLVAKSLVA